MPLYQPDVRTGHFVKQTKVELKGGEIEFWRVDDGTSTEVTTDYKYSMEWEGGGERRPVTQLARPSRKDDHAWGSSTKYIRHTESTGNLETSERERRIRGLRTVCLELFGSWPKLCQQLCFGNPGVKKGQVWKTWIRI